MEPQWNLAWWNLPQNLLAAQHGSDPENQRESETWATLVKLWWSLGGTPVEPCMVEPSAEPFSSSTRIWPRKPERVRNVGNLGKTLVEPWWNPWWNLPQNLLAAQDGSASENHRESESNSAPKPLLWLKTPKLWLLGKNNFVTADISKYFQRRLLEAKIDLVIKYRNLYNTKVSGSVLPYTNRTELTVCFLSPLAETPSS